ncbi:Chlamydia 15 kDa cysteine-rich outer membrane protein (CRPA) [Chlamydia serpentis]|uniref:Chlamydia 15 kDa cysteine-rich outer membrane protein (CRPA) n=1 Tax=Chlamydia serpentis TaxID=1967782 RepID=A0A2R8FB77_9CHLA|nr:cysteine-rich outer membrane protein [Chlamydia serpentis]SPN73675.1 Chlamydia 15 kDa cysteine-rich outer membrane protein (CRPA) [Chlamydia serpentis]
MSSNLHSVGGTAEGTGNTNFINLLDEVIEDPEKKLKDVASSPGLANMVLGWVRGKIIKPVRESKLFQSRACQITLLVLGIIFVVAGLACMFIFHNQLGANAFWLIIPAVLGLIKLLVTSLCFDEACTAEKLMVFQKWAGVLEDQLDDGVLNQSNKIFGHIKTGSTVNSRSSTPILERNIRIGNAQAASSPKISNKKSHHA